MICIFTALYHEAQPLIKMLDLKKDTGVSAFQQYSDGNEIKLVLTGPGPIRAAAAVGYIFGKEKNFTLVNYGSCASETIADPGTLYRCCKLTSGDEGRTFYPDMIVKSTLPEAEIVTSGRVWKGTENAAEGLPVLHDMEAAAIYEAGNLCLGPHQMHFLKFVSDFGREERFTPGQIRKCSEKAAGKAMEYVESLRRFDVSGAGVPDANCEKLAEDLHASVTMRAQLRQLLLYAQLAGIDTDALVTGLYEERKLPARDKRGGTKVLQELKRRILTGGMI